MVAKLSFESSYVSTQSLRKPASPPMLDTTPASSPVTAQLWPASKPSSKPSSRYDHLSTPSSLRTSHVQSAGPALASTPTSKVLLASDCDPALQVDKWPQHHVSLKHHFGYKDEDVSTSHTHPAEASCRLDDSANDAPLPGTCEQIEHAADDTAIVSKPWRQVDYLSHNWKEEDIWASWRYIVSRRNEFGHSARLENAVWRAWMKAKYKLRTMSPEAIHW